VLAVWSLEGAQPLDREMEHFRIIGFGRLQSNQVFVGYRRAILKQAINRVDGGRRGFIGGIRASVAILADRHGERKGRHRSEVGMHFESYGRAIVAERDLVVLVIGPYGGVGLPLISGPVSMREPGRFEGKAIRL
jgi:hypothetical protein